MNCIWDRIFEWLFPYRTPEQAEQELLEREEARKAIEHIRLEILRPARWIYDRLCDALDKD